MPGSRISSIRHKKYWHICGVVVSSYVHRENLILAMITGNKKIQGTSE